MLEAINNIKNEIDQIGSLNFKDLQGDTALIVVDMVKGFCNIGPLATSRSLKAINPIVELNLIMKNNKKIFFVDSHNQDSIEFKSYPIHCIKESEEEDIIDELVEYSKDSNATVIKKNSINGFHTSAFKEWLKTNSNIKNFIVTGVCTDICVETFVISLATYFNEVNEDKNIIVPMNTVETFDLVTHNGDLMNLISFYKMKSNGINIVKSIII